MNFSTEHWASHTRGKKKRAEILAYLSKYPDAKPQELAELVGLSIYQIRRHLSTIHLERGIKSLAIASALAICSIPTVSHWYLSLSKTDNVSFLASEKLKNPYQKTPYSS
jgi:hypothetical protein